MIWGSKPTIQAVGPGAPFYSYLLHCSTCSLSLDKLICFYNFDDFPCDNSWDDHLPVLSKSQSCQIHVFNFLVPSQRPRVPKWAYFTAHNLLLFPCFLSVNHHLPNCPSQKSGCSSMISIIPIIRHWVLFSCYFNFNISQVCPLFPIFHHHPLISIIL